MMLFGVIPTREITKQIFDKEGVIPKLINNQTVKENLINNLIPSLPSPSDWLGIKDKVNKIALEMHKQALLTPDPLDDKIDYLQYMYNYADGALITKFMPDWFKDIIIYLLASFNQITHFSVQFIFKHIYKFVTEIVLYTPEWIFGNDWFPTAVSNYSMFSIACIIIIAMVEGIKRMCKLSHTKFRNTLRKLPLALVVTAATPFLFVNGVKVLNRLTKLILNLSSTTIALGSPSIFATSIVFEPLNILIMFMFLIITTILCVPLILFHARRWFNFTVLGMLTPLAMSASLFESTHDYFQLWLRNIKNLSFVQIAYAIFISILGLLMFATPNPVTFTGVFSKTLLMIGGIHCLAFPPQLIKRFDSGGVGFAKSAKQMKEYTNEKIVNASKYKDNGKEILIKTASIAGKGIRFLFKK